VANHQYLFNKNDEYYTKPYAVEPIVKFVKRGAVVWCPFDKPESNFVKVFKENGYNVIHSHIDEGKNFFEYEPSSYDVIVSNPPYSRREAVFERLFTLGKPFAMLVNMAGIFDSKKRFSMFAENPFEFLVFDRRVDYQRQDNKKTSPPYLSIYICSRLLPQQMVFSKLPRLTKRAPDLWDSAPLQALSTPEADTPAGHLSTPPTSG